jgi:hypothetical protein
MINNYEILYDSFSYISNELYQHIEFSLSDELLEKIDKDFFFNDNLRIALVNISNISGRKLIKDE